VPPVRLKFCQSNADALNVPPKLSVALVALTVPGLAHVPPTVSVEPFTVIVPASSLVQSGLVMLSVAPLSTCVVPVVLWNGAEMTIDLPAVSELITPALFSEPIGLLNQRLWPTCAVPANPAAVRMDPVGPTWIAPDWLNIST
jgi:hypothetical protein